MTSHHYSLKQAAKITGKSINTIRKAIKEGRISCAEETERGYKIDPAELHRVYPAKQEDGNQDSTDTVAIDTGVDPDVKRLQSELANTYQRLEDKEKELIRLHSLAESNMRLLEDHSNKADEEKQRQQQEQAKERKEAREREAQQAQRIRELEQQIHSMPRNLWEHIWGLKKRD